MVGFKIQLPSCVLDIIANCTSLQFYHLSFKGKPASQTRQAVIYILIGRCSLFNSIAADADAAKIELK